MTKKVFPLELTKSTEELKKLIAEHPDYPIVVLAGEGVRYFSFAEQMMDENGYLSADLTSDGMCHINTEGTAIWVKALRRFAVEQYM